MGEQATVWTALGATGESVMALYAVARLLKSRDLGPAQLLPAIESNRADALKLASRLQQLFVQMRSAVADSPHLQRAVDVLEPYANEVAGQVAEAFHREVAAKKLGASERLLVEPSVSAASSRGSAGCSSSSVRRSTLAPSIYCWPTWWTAVLDMHQRSSTARPSFAWTWRTIEDSPEIRRCCGP
jgi:hypothetical protein